MHTMVATYIHHGHHIHTMVTTYIPRYTATYRGLRGPSQSQLVAGALGPLCHLRSSTLCASLHPAAQVGEMRTRCGGNRERRVTSSQRLSLCSILI